MICWYHMSFYPTNIYWSLNFWHSFKINTFYVTCCSFLAIISFLFFFWLPKEKLNVVQHVLRGKNKEETVSQPLYTFIWCQVNFYFLHSLIFFTFYFVSFSVRIKLNIHILYVGKKKSGDKTYMTVKFVEYFRHTHSTKNHNESSS